MKPAFLTILVGFVCAATTRAAEPGPSGPAVEFFEKEVRPLFVDNCLKCHGPTKQEAGLRFDSPSAILKVVVPGEPDNSRLIQAVRRTGKVKMPPENKLSADKVQVLADWVKMGAPWPAGAVDPAVRTVAAVRASHWAFRPVTMPALPAVKDRSWVKTPVDAFVLARLEAQGLRPAPEADRRTLIRRLSFDLLGLPPTPEEVQAFAKDRSADAYEKLVDRLLGDSRYGERWGRHWLDVARYADTKGYVFKEERRFPYSYTYRDYVIRSFNEDLPYDQFILQQLAADQLPLGDDKRPLAAMGFLTLGRRFLNNVNDIIDDRIDVTMRGLQGLTVGCARCHDHKFDPIPTKDYYSLQGVFLSSVEPKELPLLVTAADRAKYAGFDEELKKRTDAADHYRAEHKTELAAKNRKARDELRAFEKKVEQWKVSGPGSPPRAMILADAPRPQTPHVLLRGNPNNRGEAVPRQFLEVLAGPNRKPFTKGSGRLELAQAIASKDNPLTARVMVNRVWLNHFGTGLVRTPSNFGLRGDPPTHPELLDWLAATFTKEGWSGKKLHRLILLSSTYRQSSDGGAKTVKVDPENRLLGRMNRQRLDFEALRDSLLFVAGRLDTTASGPAVDITKPPFATRRSVYGFIDRQNLPGLFRTFDFASPDTSTPERHATTVPQQALYLMNGLFPVEQAKALAARPDVAARTTDADRIDRLHWILYGRAADKNDVALGLRFLAAAKAAGAAKGLTPWEQYAQVLLLSNEFAFVD